MPCLAFRLSANPDPEERLEEAALWKAMHDVYGNNIVALREGEEGDPSMPTFGRPLKKPFGCGQNPVPEHLDYWNDPAFLTYARRSFVTCPYDRASAEVEALHVRGLGAFVKSTRSKHAIFRIPPGTGLTSALEDMAYSFIDGGPELMIQEECRMEYEHRFFCIGREIVTDSPVQWSLTPLDFPLDAGMVYRTPKSPIAEMRHEIAESLREVAEAIGAGMEYPHASIDCAMVNGQPGVVELNPLRLGQLGLYAADVRALARASMKLLPRTSPDAYPAPVPMDLPA